MSYLQIHFSCWQNNAHRLQFVYSYHPGVDRQKRDSWTELIQMYCEGNVLAIQHKVSRSEKVYTNGELLISPSSICLVAMWIMLYEFQEMHQLYFKRITLMIWNGSHDMLH